MNIRSLLLGTIVLFNCSFAGSVEILLYTEDTPPVNYLDENGKPAGLAVDLVREIIRRTKAADNIKVQPWSRSYRMLLRNQPNTALFSTHRSAQRELLFKWVGPLLYKKVVLYKAKGSPLVIKSLDDARKVDAIGTYRDDSKEQFLEQNGFDNLARSARDELNPRKLSAGRIDLWISTSIQSKLTTAAAGINPDNIVPAVSLFEQGMYVAFSLSTSDKIVAQWQLAFEQMELDGSAAEIRNKYAF